MVSVFGSWYHFVTEGTDDFGFVPFDESDFGIGTFVSTFVSVLILAFCHTIWINEAWKKIECYI